MIMPVVLVQGPAGSNQVLVKIDRDLEHRLVMDRSRFLRQEPERAAAVPRDLPLVRLFPAQNEIDERGFTGPVWTDQSNPFSAVHLKRSLGKQLTPAETL